MGVLSKVYSCLSFIERLFFEIFDFLVLRPKAKVISIGNISMGGTGKTPVLFELLTELKEQQPNQKLAVLTRGYRCPWEKSFYELYGDGEHPFELTDEALMLNQRFPHIPVLVGKNRHHAAIIGENRFAPDMFLLDDGFQYRRLHKDFNIILWDAMSTLKEARVVPSGRLREPVERLKEADVILLTRCESAPKEQTDFWISWLSENATGIPVIKTQTLCEGVFKFNGERTDLPKGSEVLAFSAIGRPESFYSQIEAEGYSVVSKKEFRDHDRYSKDTIEMLGKLSQEKHLPLICTEKDAIKFKPEDAKKLNLNILRIKAVPVSGKSFLEEIFNRN